MARLQKDLIENSERSKAGRLTGDDVLSDVLRAIRLSGSLQFCFMPSGAWQTPLATLAALAERPPSVIPFHIVVDGTCWLRLDGKDLPLAAGDIVVLPFGTPHQLGAGADGQFVNPGPDLPPRPWREIPVLQYGGDGRRVRLLCGYLQCDAASFRPLRHALPPLLHVRTTAADDAAGWLRATVTQIAAEVDRPRTGGLFMLERLTEIAFTELLRHRIASASPESVGWLAALADPALGRCLALIHEDPKHDWSVQELAACAGLSRVTLTARFERMLETTPMRYVREWRLCLASVALSTTGNAIAVIADEAGYGTEAAFNRAFSRTYGVPPAAWRHGHRDARTADVTRRFR